MVQQTKEIEGGTFHTKRPRDGRSLHTRQTTSDLYASGIMCSLISCSRDGGVAILPSFRSGTGADVPCYLTASDAMSKRWRRAACIPTASLLPYCSSHCINLRAVHRLFLHTKSTGLPARRNMYPRILTARLQLLARRMCAKIEHSVCCFFYSSACRRDDCKNYTESSAIRRTGKSHTLISYCSSSGRAKGSPALVPLRTYKWQ